MWRVVIALLVLLISTLSLFILTGCWQQDVTHADPTSWYCLSDDDVDGGTVFGKNHGDLECVEQ